MLQLFCYCHFVIRQKTLCDQEKTLLGAAKSLEVTFPRVTLRGRHFANVIIYSDLVVARTAERESWTSSMEHLHLWSSPELAEWERSA